MQTPAQLAMRELLADRYGGDSERLRALLTTADRPAMFECKADEATLYLYDVIVGDKFLEQFGMGVAAETFVKALNELSAPTIHVRINSPGGDVFAGRAIEAAIKAHPSTIVAHVDGYAASAASYVAIAGDQVEIAPGGMMMIHNAHARTGGDSGAHLELAALLEKIDGTLRDTYAAKTGKSVEEIRALMDAETWFTGQEAVDCGLADSLAEEPKAKTKAQAEPRLEPVATAAADDAEQIANETGTPPASPGVVSPDCLAELPRADLKPASSRFFFRLSKGKAPCKAFKLCGSVGLLWLQKCRRCSTTIPAVGKRRCKTNGTPKSAKSRISTTLPSESSACRSSPPRTPKPTPSVTPQRAARQSRAIRVAPCSTSGSAAGMRACRPRISCRFATP
jgi:ATP-dependent Clp protease protease subunit